MSIAFTDKPLCCAVVLDAPNVEIRRCARTAMDGGTLCDKHKGAEAWQTLLRSVLIPGWELATKPKKVTATTARVLQRRPDGTGKVKLARVSKPDSTTSTAVPRPVSAVPVPAPLPPAAPPTERALTAMERFLAPGRR